MEALIGLDIGFGDVKVIARLNDKKDATDTDPELMFKYPTAIAYTRNGIIGDLARQEEYDFNSRAFVAGSAALQCHDLFSTRDIEFLMTYSPLLAYKAMADIARTASIPLADLLSANKRLCLGIPLAYYPRREELKRRLSAYSVSGDAVRFDNIEVRAQSQGILFDYMLDEQGRPVDERINQNVLVLDIGFNTVDVLGVIDGRPNREWSGMLENGGICRICEELKTYLQKELSFSLSEQVVKEVLQKGRVSLYGADRDLSTPVRRANEAYSDWLGREVNSRWDDFLKRADKLIIAGGGAYYVNELQDRYPREFVFIPDDPEYSNARGFLKFGMRASPTV
ncbi:MAG: ParM/StbA family protein [Pseudomonadota bacterium]